MQYIEQRHDCRMQPIVSPGNILAAEKKIETYLKHCGLSYTLKLFEKLNYIFLQTAAVVFPWKRMQSIEQQYDSWMQPIVRPGNVLDVEKKSKLTWNIANYRTLYNFLKTDNYIFLRNATVAVSFPKSECNT